MIPRYKQRGYMLDKMHRGVVNVCIMTTIFGGAILVYKGYYYYRYIRPALKAVEQKKQESLLEEGKYVEERTNTEKEIN